MKIHNIGKVGDGTSYHVLLNCSVDEIVAIINFVQGAAPEAKKSKKKRDRRKEWSPEARKAASERMKKKYAEARAAKELSAGERHIAAAEAMPEEDYFDI